MKWRDVRTGCFRTSELRNELTEFDVDPRGMSTIHTERNHPIVRRNSYAERFVGSERAGGPRYVVHYHTTKVGNDAGKRE